LPPVKRFGDCEVEMGVGALLARFLTDHRRGRGPMRAERVLRSERQRPAP